MKQLRFLMGTIHAAALLVFSSGLQAAEPGGNNRLLYNCTINPMGRSESLGDRATVGDSTNTGTIANYVVTYDDKGWYRQRFTFAWKGSSSAGENQWYIGPEHQKSCLHKHTDTAGTPFVKTRTCTGSDYWYLQSRGDGYFSISWLPAGKSAMKARSPTTNGAYWNTADYTDNSAFKFQIRDCINLNDQFVTPAP